jgi:undecaprenyl-diphosphatase
VVPSLYAVDLAIFDALYAGPAPGTVYSLMVAFTVLGTGWTLLAVVPFGFVPRTRRVASELFVVLVAVGLAVTLLKMGVHRTRPYVALGLKGYGLAVSADVSFPSGHAAGSFALASFLSLRLRVPWALPVFLFSLASAIALSRVYLGVHYPSDVAAGALLGMGIGGGAGRWLRARHLRQTARETG